MRRLRQRRIAASLAVGVALLMVLTFLPNGGRTDASRLGTESLPTPPSGGGGTGSAVGSGTTDSGLHSPHPGTLDVYEDTGDGTTADPSAAYYTVNAEPIWNVYETLVAYNGSDDGQSPSSFVPEAATCVPGSNECLSQFGNSLVYGNSSTGLPQYYTFEIDASARFYDPATAASWPVYPSDVLFSLARTLAYADYPGSGVYPGWINAQDVLPSGVSSWDGGLHAPYNNTPNRILSAFLVNATAYCPSSTVVSTNGCITWNVAASGEPWPFFLELVADPMGASIQSCGWATYTAGGPYLGAPDFYGTNARNGDGACRLPGNFTSSTSAYESYVANLSATGWDPYELQGGNYPSPQARLQWNVVGSGPYYDLNPIDPNTGYFLEANPAYAAPEGCAGHVGCLPAPGQYEPTVNVYWADNDTTGLTEMRAGWADMAEFYPTDTVPVQQIVENGRYSILTHIPTLSITFDPFELNFSLTNLAKLDTVGGINVPGTFLSNVALREFLVNAFPYATDESTIQTLDGIPYGEHYGGAIPIGMGNYYPSNISWPAGDPLPNPSVPGNVSWWWDQLITRGSPWYDPTFAACTSASPCRFPFVSEWSAPTEGLSFDNWIASIEALTNNSVQPYLIVYHSTTLCAMNGCCAFGSGPPGEGCTPIYSYGWAPDYPDPTDYVGPMYAPDSVYTYGDAVREQLSLPAFDNISACGHVMVDPETNFSEAWVNLTFWASGAGGAHGVGVGDDCQGVAYGAMVDWMDYAAYLMNPQLRGLIYDLTEQVANELALYMYWSQTLGALAYADWIDPAGINVNPMIGGGGDELWADWAYAPSLYTVTFAENRLPAGTSWSVDVAGIGVVTSTSTTLLVSQLPNGSFPFEILYVPGYAAEPANGTIVIDGGSVTEPVTFTPLLGQSVSVTFYEEGLVSGTNWSLLLAGVGAWTGNSSTANFELPPGTYYSNASAGSEYHSPPPRVVQVGVTTVLETIVFKGISFTTYAVTFAAEGLPTNDRWGVTVNGFTNLTNGTRDTFYETNGTVSWTALSVPGLDANPSSGSFAVSGAPVELAISWTASPGHYYVSFVQGGLPNGTRWAINVAGYAVSTTAPYIQVLLENGSFAWSVDSVEGYLALTASGTIAVDGASPPTVAVNFVPSTPLDLVTFVAAGTGVPSWVLAIGGTNYVETGTSASLLLAPGVYSWGVTVPSGFYASPSGGNVNVTPWGTSVTFTIASVSSASHLGPVPLNPDSLSPLAELAIGLLSLALLGVVVALLRERIRRPPPPVPPPSSPPPAPPPFAKDAPGANK